MITYYKPATDSHLSVNVSVIAIFKRLFPLAAQHNMRLVTLNARDYHGSTPFSDSELAALGSPDLQSQHSVLRACGRELCAFLVWFVEQEKIPPMSASAEGSAGRRGGISLLGWSFGSAFTFSFLAQAGALSEETRTLLGAYLRTIVGFGESRFVTLVPTSRPLIPTKMQAAILSVSPQTRP